MLGDVPNDWDVRPLRRLLSANFPGDWGAERGPQMTRVLRSTNLTTDGRLDLEDVALRALARAKAKSLTPRRHDILLERSGGGPGQPVGRVGFVQVEMPGHGFSNFLHLLRPDTNEVDARFLGWVLYRVNRTGRVVRLEQQTTQMRNLHFRDYLTMPLPVPPPDEQAAIARILDSVDRALERTRAAVERARVFHHSLLHDVLEMGLAPNGCSKHGLPRHWTTRRVDEVADVGSGVTLGKDLSGFESVELPYLRVANVQDGYLDLSTIKTVRVRTHEVGNFRLEVGDVLMTEGGDIDKLGRGAIWKGQIPECLHQNHIFRIRPKRDLLEPAFYALIVESDFAKRYFNRVAKRTTNLASTNKTQVRAFRFPVPPTLDEQLEIVTLMDASKATIAAIASQEEALSELKRALMHDLFTGRVRLGPTSKVAAS